MGYLERQALPKQVGSHSLKDCMKGQKLFQKWGTASSLMPPAEGLWPFYRLFLNKGCAYFCKEILFPTPTLCCPKQSDSGLGVSEAQWASSTAAVQKMPTTAHTDRRHHVGRGPM